MSSILPLAIINALRNSNNVAVQAYGIQATLYLATNDTAVENLDDYQNAGTDYLFNIMPVLVWIEWSPNSYRLRKLGLFVKESDMPIIVHFDNRIEVTRYSYLTIPVTFLPTNQKDAQQFEIVDQQIAQFADVDVKRTYAMVPRRIPT